MNGLTSRLVCGRWWVSSHQGSVPVRIHLVEARRGSGDELAHDRDVAAGGGVVLAMDGQRTFSQVCYPVAATHVRSGQRRPKRTSGVPPASSHDPALAPAFKSSSTQFSCPGKARKGTRGYASGSPSSQLPHAATIGRASRSVRTHGSSERLPYRTGGRCRASHGRAARESAGKQECRNGGAAVQQTTPQTAAA